MSLWICQHCRKLQGFTAGMRCFECGGVLEFANLANVIVPSRQVPVAGRPEPLAPSPEPLAASSSPAPRPDGWLDGEIELTAFALAHPDCDVRAVLRGFAEWILAAPKDHP